MSIEQLPPHVRVTRFYTAVRRIPTLVGKLPNGGFIPGGPYTLGQVALMLLVAVGGFYTMPWWGGGQGANLGNFIKLALAVVLTSMASSKIRWRGRQVLPALRGAVYSYTHGSQPRQGGRTPTGTGPQRLRTNILIIEELPASTTRARASEPQARQVDDTRRQGSEGTPSASEPTKVRPPAASATATTTAATTAATTASAVAAPARSGALARRQPPAAASANAQTTVRPQRTLRSTAVAAPVTPASPHAPTPPQRPAPGPVSRRSSTDRNDRPELTEPAEVTELVNAGGGR